MIKKQRYISLFSHQPKSSHNLINPALLQLPHLLPEGLDLLPAVQRPPVVLEQTADDVAAGLLHGLGQGAELLPLVETRAQGLYLGRYCLGAAGRRGGGGVLF